MPRGGGPVRVRCVDAEECDAVFSWGGCGFGLGARARVCGGGSGWKNDTSIPVSLSSPSSTCTHMVVSARDVGANSGFSQSESDSVRSMTSCMRLSPSGNVGSGVLVLRAGGGSAFGIVDARAGRREVGFGSHFRVWLGSEAGVHFPDMMPAPGPRLAVFAKTPPRGSELREDDKDVLDTNWGALFEGPAGQIAEALEVLVRGRALRLLVTKPVRLSTRPFANGSPRSFSRARVAKRCFFSEFSSSFLNASLRSSTKATASGSSS